jgi:hypothetical protein
MWICLSNSFLSIVEDFTCRSTPPDLLVRARLKGDIETLFPNAEVRVGEGSDYRYRATLPRHVVADTLARKVMPIGYTNFESQDLMPGGTMPT